MLLSVPACSEIERIEWPGDRRWAGIDASGISEGQRPQAADRNRVIIRVLHKAEKASGHWVEGCDIATAEISNQYRMTKFPKISAGDCYAPRCVEPGTTLQPLQQFA